MEPIGADILAGIGQLHARYVDALCRLDADAFAACWSRDAEWRIAHVEAHGRGEIAAAFVLLTAPAERVLMLPGLPLLARGAAGEVTGEVTVSEFIKRRDGTALRTIGRYRDCYRTEDGAWRFARRIWSLLYRGDMLLEGGIESAVAD